MRSFDNDSNPFKYGASFRSAAEPSQPAYTTLAPNPNYSGKMHLPSRMDGHERAIVSGQMRIVTTQAPR